MQALARLSVSRPVVATVLILVFVVVGLFSLPKLGLDRFPNMDVPTVTVQTVLKGATPEEIDTQVTEEIEKQVNTVAGIDYISSSSAEGISVVMVRFEMDKDVDTAANEVRAKCDLAMPNLPDDTDKPIVQKVDPASSAIIAVALSSDTTSIRDLTEYADKTLRPQLENASGVGEADLVGGQLRQINVLLDPYALRSFDLTAVDVKRALASQNLQVPGGSLDEGQRRIAVRTRGRVETMAEMGEVVVKVKQGQPIRLADVAQIEDGGEELESIANVDGKPAVLINIRKQSGANTIAVINAVKERLKLVTSGLPPAYKLRVVSDQSTYIEASLNAVKEHLILGAILASLVVLLFLWNWRSALISSIAIPASLVSTFGLMAARGFTMNVVTMLALTLAVGIVIDDAVIVLENIYRHLEEKRLTPREAALSATAEIGLAVLATTFSLIAVFLPIAFMSGIIGRVFSSFGMTMSFAILMSLIVAFTLAPMLSARWLRRPGETLRQIARGEGWRRLRRRGAAAPATGEAPAAPPPPAHHAASKAGLFGRIENAYAAILTWSLDHRWVVVLAALLVFFSIVPLGKVQKVGFMPDDDESRFDVAVRAAEGTSLHATEALLNRIAADVRKLPEVSYTVVTVGDDREQTQNLGNIAVHMNEVEERNVRVTQQQLMTRVRKDVVSRYPRDLRVVVSPPNVMGGGAEAQVQYVITGPDLDTLIAASERIVTKLKTYPDAADCDTSAIVGKPELGVSVDRNAAADLGVSVSDVATTLRTLVAGEVASQFSEHGYQYDINVRALPEYRDTEENLALFTVPSSKDGVAPVPLTQVVTTRAGGSLSIIKRFSRNRQVTVSANPAPGASEQALQLKIAEFFKAEKLPSEYRGMLSGRSRELGTTMTSFATALLLAIIFSYLILAAQFESWLTPLVILTILPLTLPFALFSVWVMGGSMNIFSMLGLLVLFGVVMKNAILQVDHTNGLREKGLERNAAIVQACRDRLRPILMTTIAFVAGMIPLVVSQGTGAGTNHAMSQVIIGGQILSLALSLIATPVFYSLMDGASSRMTRLKMRLWPHHAPVEHPAEGPELSGMAGD